MTPKKAGAGAPAQKKPAVNLPPLPSSMTLAEAAQVMTGRTGKAWADRGILACAEHHEITICAPIGHAVRLVRSEPIDGTENELQGPAGCLPPLSAKAVRALLNVGRAEFDGWEHERTVEIFGARTPAWTMEWELAPGEVAPVVRLEDCRVSAAGVLQLAAQYSEAELPAAVPQSSTTKTMLRDEADVFIDAALEAVKPADDLLTVWSRLQVMAAAKPPTGTLFGAADGKLQYLKNGEVGYLSRDALGKRLKRRKAP